MRSRPLLAGAGGGSGAVVLAQRFGGALTLNLHLYALALDDIYAGLSPSAAARIQRMLVD